MTMTSRRIAIMIFGIGLAGPAGWVCACRESESLPTSQPARIIVDMSGREVRVPLRPARVLSLCTSATDTLIRLGQAPRLAAMDEYSRIIPGTEDIPTVGKGSAISREQVIARGIDLAFIWWFQDDAAATLEQLSIPCVRVTDLRLGQVGDLIRFVGDCLDCPGEAQRLAASLPATASRPAADSSATVYLEMYGPYKTVGQECYINDLLQQAGLRNIVTDCQGGLLISAERLIQADPSVILFVDEFASVQTISHRAGLHDLSAVRTGRVRAIDRRWLVAGAGWPGAVEGIRRAAGAASASAVASADRSSE